MLANEADVVTDLANETKSTSPKRENVAFQDREDQLGDLNPYQRAAHIVKGWEHQSHRHLSKRNRDLAVKIALLHTVKKRGVIRTDFEHWGFKSADYARRKIYLLTKSGFLVPITGRRIGRFQEYFISTEIDNFLHPVKEKESDADHGIFTFMQFLVGFLSNKKPTFHKLAFRVEIPPEFYMELRWPVADLKNKSKIKEFRIGFRRTVKFVVSPNGTTMLYIESTQNPYSLHIPSELVQLFSDLGEASNILKAECSSNDIPQTNCWKLKHFDRDITIPTTEIEKNIPSTVLRFWSEEGVQLGHLGELFQIYGKVLPEKGKVMRFESNSTTTKEEKPVDVALFEAINPEIKFVSALEVLEKRVTLLEREREGTSNPVEQG